MHAPAYVLETVIAGDDDHRAIGEPDLGQRAPHRAHVGVHASHGRLRLGAVPPDAVLEVIGLHQMHE